jgi:hypothetical protein
LTIGITNEIDAEEINEWGGSRKVVLRKLTQERGMGLVEWLT